MADISEEQAELTAMFGATKKKKKTTTKKTAEAAAEGDAAAAATEGATDATTVASSSAAKAEEKKADAPFRMYDYEFLLNRVMTLVQQNNPELVEKSRTKMPPPQVQRRTWLCLTASFWREPMSLTLTLRCVLLLLLCIVGTKKTHWTNFNEICLAMARQPDHVFQFFMAELGTEGSIDGNKQLIIRGKFAAKVSHLVAPRSVHVYELARLTCVCAVRAVCVV